MVVACICPQLVVRDLSGVDGMGPVEEVVEVVTLHVCDGVVCYVGIRGILCKLLSNQSQGAVSDMIIGLQDVVVPVMEMGILLVEDL